MSDHPFLATIRGLLPNRTAPFVLMADIKIQPGRGDDFANDVAKSQTIRLSRLEAGCIAYDVCRDVSSADRFFAYEQWRDLAALESHFATRHFAEVSNSFAALLAEPPTIRIMSVLEP